MVYRSSRRPPANEDEVTNLQDNTSFDSSNSDKEVKFLQQAGTWKKLSILLLILCVGLLIGIIVISSGNAGEGKVPLCGKGSNSVSRVLDTSEPKNPGPFHDLTVKEIESILTFLRNDPSIKLKNAKDAQKLDSVVYTMEILPAKKADVLAYLAGKRAQPDRQARVILFRRDLNPPMVHELTCGPLPKVTSCALVKSKNRRNPIEYGLRPIMLPQDLEDIYNGLIPVIEKQMGHILQESFGASFTECKAYQCLKFYPGPMGSNIIENVNTRLMWLTLFYDIEYYGSHVIDIGLLANLQGVDPDKFHISKVWYHGQFFESVDDFVLQYNENRIKKITMRPKAVDPKDSFSSLFRRGDPFPEKPQRPPTLVEPDGRRYSLKHREVKYLGWEFNFNMNPVNGPGVFNVRYRGERIAYEISLSEMAVLYASHNPMQRMTDYIDSGAMMGMMSRTLVPGSDCPETSTFISQTFPDPMTAEPLIVKKGFCLFENNNGYPVRRHSSYSQYEGAFYGGMMDTVLILRSVLTVVNYDYVVDFIFHQTGAIQTRVLSTGYILPAFHRATEEHYGWHLHKNFTAPIHQHAFNFKVDLDISGTSNRYETLDIKPDKIKLRYPAGVEYNQVRFDRNLRKTEKEAVFDYNFDQPKYHIVHNDAKRTDLGEVKAYRLHLNGMTKQLKSENKNNENTFSWTRHQLVVTKQKDDEISSGSPYGMYDSLNPITNFTNYYEDDENIVDEDLVFWVTCGLYHIPHTEDLPITPTVGGHVNFILTPYNYFRHCPSFNSRDHVRIQLKDINNPSEGVTIDRNGYKDEQCRTRQFTTAYDELLRKEPDDVVEA